MSSKPLFGSLCLAPFLVATAHAGEPTLITAPPAVQEAADSYLEALPAFDLGRIAYLQTGGMDIDGTNSDLTLRKFEFRSFFSKPITVLGGVAIIPMFSYEMTNVDFDGFRNPLLHDEDLHSFSLSTFLFKDFQNTPWFAAGWANAELATDFQNVGSDSFTYDVALGVGYRLSDTFTIAAGAAAININSDVEFYPGINFDWKPNDTFQVGLYGPNLLATYTMNEAWNLSLRGTPNGGTWVYNNDINQSRTLDISSYTLGIYTENNVFGNFWLSAGVGYTFLGEIEVRNNHGANSTSRDLDSAPYAEISLGLRRW